MILRRMASDVKKKGRIGSSFDDFLKQEGICKRVTSRAVKRYGIFLKMLPWRSVVCGRIFGAQSPHSLFSFHAGLLMMSGESSS